MGGKGRAAISLSPSPVLPAVAVVMLASATLLPASAANSADAQAMWNLALSLSNPPPSWKPGVPDPCSPSWEGVRCDGGRVVDINLARSSLSGSLPKSLGSLSALKSLQLQRNGISGAIPSLASLSALERLDLEGNAFSAVPADLFSGLPALLYVDLDNNPFAPWAVPAALAGCTALTTLSASNASLTGPLPDVFASLSSLQSLRLSYNNLTGELPPSLAISALEILSLNNQRSAAKLTGRIDVIGAMPQLTVVLLQSNGFTGPIPDLSNLTSLESFNVRDNALTGVVPPSLISMTKLQNASLSNNRLQGPFPEFAASGALLDIDSGNNFCNPSPGPCDARVAVLLDVALGFGYPLVLASSWKGDDPCAGGWVGVSCDGGGKNVTVLNFANQNFSGTISPAVANLTSLTRLILSNNQLRGGIPDGLGTLPQLQLLDVTNNHLSGHVPKFPDSVILRLSGNQFGGSYSGTEGGSSEASSDSSAGSQKASVIAGSVVAVIVLVSCSLALVLQYRRRKVAKKFGPVLIASPPSELEAVKIGVIEMNGNGGLNELYRQSSTGSGDARRIEMQGMQMPIQSLRKATDNFSERNILGKGGFGVVYKGNHNGILIAVKRSEYDATGKKGQQEFMAEIDVLRKVKHRNVVALLGYCNIGTERLLVYEYMPGGTLGQHLFDHDKSGYPLTWKQRLSVALDVARGIEYLHSLAQETFIHRDLKPSNILLDDDMRAKVSDFGLVKLATDREKSMMTRLAGTFGYLAPEYAITGKISTKVDVYAYGVILMELITGRKVLDDTLPEDEVHLVGCFRRNILDKERFMKSVDPTLDLDEEARRGLMEVADLARHCTAREPSQRPDMSHCVNRLATLVDQWKPTGYDEEDNEEAVLGWGFNQRLEDITSTTELFGTNNGGMKHD